jgi:uncharacterized membrane protein
MPHGTAVLFNDDCQLVDEALRRVRIINNIDRWAALVATRPIAQPLVLLASATIFAAAALDRQLPQPWFAAAGNGVATTVIGIVVVAAGVFAARRSALSDSLTWTIAVAWFAATSACAFAILASGPSVGVIVALVEGAVLFAACLTLARGRTPAILHYLLSAMLILFGAIHLLWHDAIAQLVPDFMPFGIAWPWVTGSLQLAAGLASISIRLAKIAFPLVAVMFLAWIPIVHLPRLLDDPSTGEFSFAAMAVALAGCLLLAAGLLRTHPRPAP